MRRSLGSIWTSTSSASGSTRTPAAEVWIRPWDSVTGTRWTRCTPPSNFSRAYGRVAGLDGAACLDRDLDVLVAAEVGLLGVQDLGPPPATFGVPQVHPQQVGGEQRGLLAALACLDLEDDVLVVHRVAWHQQQGQPLGDALALCCRRVGLSSELGVLGGQLAGRDLVLAELEPLAVGGDDRAQLGMPLADPAGCRGIRVQRRVGHLLLKVGVLALEGEAVLEHL